MRVAASAWYELFSPTECAKRVRLIAAGVQGAAPGAYEVVLEELGNKHEADYLATLEPAVRVGDGADEDRVAATLQAIRDQAAVVYQPFFKTTLQVEGEEVELVGNPDFLVRSGEGYLIRDAKLARHTSRDEKPEVFCQIQAYGYLHEAVLGHPAVGLEVFDGQGLIQSVVYEGPDAFRAALSQLVRLRNSALATYAPVGWSKCLACSFKPTCWPEAEARRDVSLVYGVSQGMAKSLQEAGIATIGALAGVDPERLSRVAYGFGSRVRTIGAGAGALIRAAKALDENREIAIAPPVIPPSANYVSFDLEGVPIPASPEEIIYLWGIQVFGANPGPYQGITSDFEEGGDRRGWMRFLEAMDRIFQVHSDIPLVVYSPYESTHVRLYINRYGDWNGVGERVMRNLWDMLPAIKNAVALPLCSYSLKQVELHVGFERTQEEFGGSWSIAQYFRAMQSYDPAVRQAIMGEILTYNAEDLQATIQVFDWLRCK